MDKIACVFGGTGFIGTQVVRALCRAGYRVKIPTRVPERVFELKTSGTVGQVTGIACDFSPEQIAAAVRGSDAVINLIGILYEKKHNAFERLHAELPGRIATACMRAGVERFIHVSALGIEQNASRYARSKKAGEDAAKKEFPAVTILRPSIVFGAADSFFNRFASLAEILPALPLIGGGKTKFQPVYVGDIAEAVMAALRSDAARGKVYELGGPEVFTFKELMRRLLATTRQSRFLLPIPFGIAKIQGAVLGLLPRPPLTIDQVESLKSDNVVRQGAPDLRDLGIAPTALDVILPTYLKQYRPGGRFADKKQA